MSDDSSARGPIARVHRIPVSREHLLVFVLLVLGAALYLHQTFQYYMHDDEGTYAYAAWRISAGEVPYRDFLTSEMPCFLYWGGLVVRLFGRSYVPLRLVTMALMLLAAYLLYATNRELFGFPVGICSMALFLIEPNVFHNSRFFRAEAYMLVLELAGLYAFALAQTRRRTRYAALAGTFFGFSTLSKLFGVLPLAGCLLYLLYSWRRERRPFRQVVRQGLALCVPPILLLGAASLVFSAIAPHFYAAVFEHHTMQGAGMPILERAQKALALYRGYISSQPLAVALAALGGWLVLRSDETLPSLLAWQVPTALTFLAFSRELQQRYLAYLAPALVTLMAVSLVHWLGMQQRRIGVLGRPRRSRQVALVLGVTVVLAPAVLWPWVDRNRRDVAPAEGDSSHLAALIQSLAAEDQLVVADYPGLNFLAGRRTTYWAAELSEVSAESGQIRGAMLIDEIERGHVAVVLINTWGGGRHLAAMSDYPEFLDYVGSHFVLAERYKCSYEPKVFEFYARPENIPPELSGGPPPATQGGWIELHARIEDGPASTAAWAQLWTVVQWQDGTGAWHDVEGWQAAPEASGDGVGRQVWSVSPTDLGAGPFRWLVLRGRQGAVLATSDPFHLPSGPGETTRVELAVTP